MTTYSLEYIYLTDEGKRDETDAEEGTARGSTMLGRPNIVGVDRSMRTSSEMQGKWATRIAADIEELGYGGSRVVRRQIKEWPLLTHRDKWLP